MKNEQTERYAETLDDAFKCYYSDKGCFKIPVRLIVEKPSMDVLRGGVIETDAVLLCRDHASTFVVKDALIDKQIVTDEMLKQFEEWGI
jgi:hypothetical protein